jgi:hypothetical protein
MILRLLPFGSIDSEYIWRQSRGFKVDHGAEYTLVFLAHVREPVLVRVRYGSGWSAGSRLREFYVPRFGRLVCERDVIFGCIVSEYVALRENFASWNRA